MKPIDPSDMALHTWIAVLQASVHPSKSRYFVDVVWLQ
jgi:hypothetical protein